jgi:hypothetical protein
MLDAAPHRGGHQQVREHGAVALGVSQDDEVADASISTGNGLVAAFSGRLDNAADLRQQLAAHGRAAAGETPADVVEEAFRVWGEGAPARLRGQFAAAVTDGEGRRGGCGSLACAELSSPWLPLLYVWSSPRPHDGEIRISAPVAASLWTGNADCPVIGIAYTTGTTLRLLVRFTFRRYASAGRLLHSNRDTNVAGSASRRGATKRS